MLFSILDLIFGELATDRAFLSFFPSAATSKYKQDTIRKKVFYLM